jgi:hypothetical protein
MLVSFFLFPRDGSLPWPALVVFLGMAEARDSASSTGSEEKTFLAGTGQAVRSPVFQVTRQRSTMRSIKGMVASTCQCAARAWQWITLAPRSGVLCSRLEVTQQKFANSPIPVAPE